MPRRATRAGACCFSYCVRAPSRIAPTNEKSHPSARALRARAAGRLCPGPALMAGKMFGPTGHPAPHSCTERFSTNHANHSCHDVAGCGVAQEWRAPTSCSHARSNHRFGARPNRPRQCDVDVAPGQAATSFRNAVTLACRLHGQAQRSVFIKPAGAGCARGPDDERDRQRRPERGDGRPSRFRKAPATMSSEGTCSRVQPRP